MVLIGTIMAATLFGYSIGMIVGLKVQLKKPQAPKTQPVSLSTALRPGGVLYQPSQVTETRIEHPAASTSGVGRIHSFM